MLIKKTIIFTLVIALLLSFASCKGDDKKVEEETKPDESENKVSLTPESNKISWWWNANPDDVYVSEFLATYPDYEVDNSYATCGPLAEDYSIDLNMLVGAMASGDQPDLFTGYCTAVEAYYSDMFMPIQEYFDADPEFKVEDMDSQVFETTTFNDLIYFMPLDYSSQIFCWNKDMFEAAGLDPDTPPKTWAEFLEYCEKLNTYNTDGSLKVIGAYQNHMQWDTWHIISTGEHYVDKTGLNMNINTPSYLELMELIMDIEKTYGGNDKRGTGGLGWWFLFENVAMSQWSASGLGFLASTVNFGLGMSRSPQKEAGGEYYSAAVVDSFLGIPRGAKNPKGGWLLLKFVSTEGRIPVELDKFNKNPTNFMTDYIVHKPTREKIYEVFAEHISEDLMERMKYRDSLVEECNRAYYKLAYYNKWRAWYEPKFQDMLDHKIAPQDFLREAQTNADAFKKEFIETKKAEGWIFNEDGTSIPPSLQKK